jgi:hypothetical protein
MAGVLSMDARWAGRRGDRGLSLKESIMPCVRTHPGEVLREEYLVPLGMSARALREGAVDFPQQHRRTGGCAAATGKLAIDDHYIQTLAREALGDQQPGNAAADDQRIAFHLLADVEANSLGPVTNQGERPPRRSACSVSSESGMLITNLTQ